MVGPSVQTVVEEPPFRGRFTGVIAKRVCKEMVLALDFLHEQDIGHGGQSDCFPTSSMRRQVERSDRLLDLHTGNVAFTIPSLDSLSEEMLHEKLGNPQTAPVSRSGNIPRLMGMPEYLVWPVSFPVDGSWSESPTKLIDFGESFTPSNKPQTLHTPLALRAPELLFEDKWDLRSDLWSLGCMVSLVE